MVPGLKKNNSNNNNNNNLHSGDDPIYPVKGLHPHFVGGISLIQTARFNPYPAFPPYDVRTLHPGLRPTSAT